MKTKKGIVAFLLAAALLVSMVGMASASIHWYLDSTEGAETGLYKMWQEDWNTPTGTVSIGAGESEIWTADQAAVGDVYFPAKSWSGDIKRVGTTGDETYTAYIGYYDDTGWHSAGNSGEVTIDAGVDGKTFSLSASGFTVPNGKWLAFRITSSTGITVKTGGYQESFVYYPYTDPPYPNPPIYYVDIKPGSCPNAFNSKRWGVMSVAVLGTEDFDVTTVDPETILLSREDFEGVAPLRWSYEDVATPFEGELCECHELGGDGYEDLVLKFYNQELVNTLGLSDKVGNVALTLTGNLYDGTPIKGEDCIWINEAKAKK